MRFPVIAESVTTTVDATVATVDCALVAGTSYELAVTTDTWVRLRRADQEGDVEPGKRGSMLVFKGRVLPLTGYQGSVLTIVRDKGNGLAVLTPTTEA